MKNSALGLIETYGFVGAVEAADAALKAAEVTVVDLVKVKGGIMTLTLQGEVSAVKASVDAGAASAERLGVLLSSHVIPRLDEEVWPMVLKKEKDPEPPPEDPEEDKNSEPFPAEEEVSEEERPLEPIEEEGSQIMEKPLPKQENFTKDMMEKLKVVELRRIARGVEGMRIPKNQIKFANKETLLKEIITAQERRGKS
jgi:microcompartment protein CcmL/EutN